MSWARHGECNDCGWCCQTYSRTAIVRDPHAGDQAFYRARGFQPTDVGGKTLLVLMAWVDAPCPQHTGHESSSCAIYADRPMTCRQFPTVPADIAGTPCSYWFESGPHRVGGSGSPYPTTTEQLLALESA